MRNWSNTVISIVKFDSSRDQSRFSLRLGLPGWPLGFAVLAIVIALGAPAAWAQAQVGTISRLAGSAQVQRGGASLNAAPAMAIDLHDRITTGASGSLTITLADNSSLELAESSSMEIDESVVSGGTRTSTRVSLLAGSLRSLVTQALSGAAPTFEVHTPNAIAGVRGTNFETSYSTGTARPTFGGCLEYTDVAVDDGLVNVANKRNPGGGSVDVPGGYETTIACAQMPFFPGPLGVTGATGSAAGFTAATPGVGAAAAPVCPVLVCPVCTSSPK